MSDVHEGDDLAPGLTSWNAELEDVVPRLSLILSSDMSTLSSPTQCFKPSSMFVSSTLPSISLTNIPNCANQAVSPNWQGPDTIWRLAAVAAVAEVSIAVVAALIRNLWCGEH